MSFLVEPIHCVLERIVKLGPLLGSEEHASSEVVGISDLERVEAHEVCLPALAQILLHEASLGPVEVAVLLGFVLTVFRLALCSALLVSLSAVPLRLEVSPPAVVDVLLSKFALHVFVVEVLVVRPRTLSGTFLSACLIAAMLRVLLMRLRTLAL